MKMKKMSVRRGRRRCNVKKRGGGTPKIYNKTSKTRRTPPKTITPRTEKKKTTTRQKITFPLDSLLIPSPLTMFLARTKGILHKLEDFPSFKPVRRNITDQRTCQQ